GRSGQNLWIQFRVANERGPGPREGIQRLNLHQGTWVLEPLRGGQVTRVRYHFRIDLGSGLPGWMTRSATGKAVAGLFQAVRRQVQQAVDRDNNRASAVGDRGV